MKHRAVLLLAFGIVLVLLFCLPSKMGAQAMDSQFLSRKLQEISELLKERQGIDCTATFLDNVAGCPLVVQRNGMNQISHIGFKLFSRQLTESNPSPIYHFAERYLLELCLTENDAALQKKLKEDKVTLYIGNNKEIKVSRRNLSDRLPGLISCPSLFATTDNTCYTMTWNNEGKVLLFLRFPIQYELLWGMNKAEIENLFYPSLSLFKEQPRPTEQLTAEVAEALTVIEDSCLVSEGEMYAVESMNTNRYYRKEGQRYVPLYDINHPEMSIRNLFTLGADKRIAAAVVQRKYGLKKEKFTVPLSRLLSFARQGGCEIFVGIESIEKGKAKGMAIMLNRAMGYNHLLYFDTDLRILQYPGHYKMNIELYAYVPTHNIANLYSDKKTTQQQ